MPGHRKSLPRYRFHKASGQARVTLHGKDFYLGPFNSLASKREYDRVISEWLAAGRHLSPAIDDQPVSIVEMLAAYWRFASRHYCMSDGSPGRELDNIRYALRPLRRLYGPTLVQDFAPISLKALQGSMVQDGLCRAVINSRINRIKRAFKWAVSEQLCPPAVFQSLQTVTGLRKGRTDAREPGKVQPVDDEIVEATIEHLPEVVADMVRLQRLLGCRPGEVCDIRPCDVDRGSSIWVYRPARHKTAHLGRERTIFVGPRAQSILKKYLLRSPEAYCFSPSDSEQKRMRMMRVKRKSSVQPSQFDRSKPRRRRPIGSRYNKDSFANAIRRACGHAFPPPSGLSKAEQKEWRRKHSWSPNQLRHAAATELRRRFGLEGAQVILGHSRADVTQLYAERDQILAVKIMSEVG